jgi:methionyl-tRNA formyltransferase
LHDRLARLAPEALMEALPLIEAGIAPRLKQDDTLATHAPKLDKAAGRITWTDAAVQIERHIRAMNPWPGAFTIVRDAKGAEKLLKVHSAIVLKKTSGHPGRILEIDDRGIVVGTGAGAILLKTVQLEGRNQVTAAAFARGARLMPGAELG